MSTPSELANINLFVIVGDNDSPLYEVDLSSEHGRRDDSTHLDQFILHAALDEVDVRRAASSDMLLGAVDTFNDFTVAAMVCPNPKVRFLLLHRYVTSPPVRRGQMVPTTQAEVHSLITERHNMFFKEAYLLFVRFVMSPLYKITFCQRIHDVQFDRQIRALGSKHLIW